MCKFLFPYHKGNYCFEDEIKVTVLYPPIDTSVLRTDESMGGCSTAKFVKFEYGRFSKDMGKSFNGLRIQDVSRAAVSMGG